MDGRSAGTNRYGSVRGTDFCLYGTWYGFRYRVLFGTVRVTDFGTDFCWYGTWSGIEYENPLRNGYFSTNFGSYFQCEKNKKNSFVGNPERTLYFFNFWKFWSLPGIVSKKTVPVRIISYQNPYHVPYKFEFWYGTAAHGRISELVRESL